MRLDRGARVPREARLPRGARAPGQKEKKAAARRAPTAEEAHRMHARNTLPTLFKTTRRPQSPRRRACCKVFRLRRRGGRWVGGKWGEALERALRRRPPALPAAPGARERRGAACADLLPDTFPPFPVNGCRSGRESGSLRLRRAASSG